MNAKSDGKISSLPDPQPESRPAPSQVVSRQRVADYGEVYTGEREVNAMLDLVKSETGRIESRFLEPACGTGNFLVEVYRRKLAVVEARYKKDLREYERCAVIATASLYGIDILEDNVNYCRARLFMIFTERYIALFKQLFSSEDLFRTLNFVLERNIIWGDALSLKTADNAPIIFSEWEDIGEGKIKRRDFSFQELLYHSDSGGLELFSDAGEDVFIPNPVRDFPPVHFLRLWEMERRQNWERNLC
jgi:SAM-dependent methyltransferase